MHDRARSRKRLRTAVVVFATAAACWTGMSPAAVAAPLVVIDPGHGGPYSNANANGLREKTVNYQIALELRRQLIARGYRVILTRTGDRAVTMSDIPTWTWSDRAWRWTYARDGKKGYVGGIPKDDLQARVDLANSVGADLFISIHNNGSVSSSARGTETWASGRDTPGARLARLVQKAVVRQTGLRDRGAGSKDFYVLRWSNMPALLVEGAFITNSQDAGFLRSSSGRRKIASGVAQGVSAWFAADRPKPIYPRVSAPDAVSLAVAVASRDYPGTAPAVVLAPADRLAEVPGAASLASSLGAPLVLLPPESGGSAASAAVTQQLQRLRPQRVIAVGPAGFPTPAVLGSVARAAGVSTSTVEVVSGANPVETAALIAGRFGAAAGTIALAPADDPDMVALAAQTAALERIPLLLTSASTLPPAVCSYLAQRSAPPSYIVVFGAPAAIPDSALAGRLPGGRRVWGADAYQAAALELNQGYSMRNAGTLNPVVADARDLGARLIASTHAAKTGQPVVLVAGSMLSSWTREWLSNNRSATAGFEIVSGARPVPYLVDWMLAKADAL